MEMSCPIRLATHRVHFECLFTVKTISFCNVGYKFKSINVSSSVSTSYTCSYMHVFIYVAQLHQLSTSHIQCFEKLSIVYVYSFTYMLVMVPILLYMRTILISHLRENNDETEKPQHM